MPVRHGETARGGPSWWWTDRGKRGVVMFSLAVPYSAPARGGGGPAALGGRRGGASGVRCFSGFFSYIFFYGFQNKCRIKKFKSSPQPPLKGRLFITSAVGNSSMGNSGTVRAPLAARDFSAWEAYTSQGDFLDFAIPSHRRAVVPPLPVAVWRLGAPLSVRSTRIFFIL